MSEDRWPRVEELYHAAMGLPPEQRAAFVEDASSGDSQLRREVESLLAEHNSEDSIFDQPAWTGLSPGGKSVSRTEALFGEGAVLGPYRIIGLLGAGGMGQVYRAHDSRLDRSVAIKVLFPGQDVRRFEREARTVAALSHPNVVPIFDVGHDGGVDYLVEELVEGESLRDLLRRGPLDVARCRQLAVQIAEGLAAAHRAGIIHRDLKPRNIMVSREDCARILDFGLATILRAGSDEATLSLPHHGAMVGTAAYMSPEQVQGGKVDIRSDIFSYGAVLYEMITGRQAFARETIMATLAAVQEGDPPSVGEIVAGVPPKLSQIIQRCLSKDPGSRFQAIDEVRLALADLEKDTHFAVAVRPHRGRRAAVRSFAAAVVIGLAVGGWLVYSRKAQVLTNKDTVVLADFANSTGDPVFDDALKQGLAVQLGQSPLINILSEQKVRTTLREMTRSPDEALTAKVAQEVCERAGSKAYIAGSIANLGGHYVIGLNAVNCATGDALAREQTEAADKQQVLAALGRVAERLRNKLGESLNSIQRFGVPLAQATTSSLEALKAYSFGLSQYAKGNDAGSVPLFQKAIELDPDFAIAHAHLGVAYHLLVVQEERMEEALRKAFELRNRTSEREKFNISAVYYQFVTSQSDEAIQNCELWAKAYPLDFAPHRILGFEHSIVGRVEQSAEETRKAIDLDPSQVLPYSALMFAYMGLSRLAEAHALYQEAQARKLASAELDRARYVLAFLEGDQETMTKAAAAMARQRVYEIKGLLEESKTEAYFGHFRRAQELSRQAEDACLREGARAGAADIEAMEAMREGLFGISARARARAAAAWKLGLPPPVTFAGAPGTAVEPWVALALAGDPVLATKVADRLASNIPPGGFAGKVWLPEIRAAIELKRGNPMRAVEFLATVEPYEAGLSDRLLAAYLRGEAYLAGRRGREAAAEFQKLVNNRGVVLNSPIGALAHLGAARSYTLEGDTPKAGAAYEDFLTLWKDADPGIPILIAAKAEYAKLK
jgi:tetratricopeptide (TPR) repeat protein/predicted Ser/Thr protein kinase